MAAGPPSAHGFTLPCFVHLLSPLSLSVCSHTSVHPRPSSALLLSGVAALLAARADAVVKIGMIGDSITAGVCGQNGGYPTLVQGLLGANYKVTNFGNSGKTMLKYGQPGDSSYWNQTTWPAAQADDSDIYTILLGTNDAKNGPGAYNWFPCNSTDGWHDCAWVDGDDYRIDYLEMIATLKAQPARPRVFVMQPTPLYAQMVFGQMNQTVTNFVLPRLLPTIVAASDAEPAIIDTFNALGGANLTKPGITCDGCHPTQAGYTLMANAIYAVLKDYIDRAGLPGFKPASRAQLLASMPRPEWNSRHPEIFEQSSSPLLVEEV